MPMLRVSVLHLKKFSSFNYVVNLSAKNTNNSFHIVSRLPTIPLNRFPYLLPKDSDRSYILRHFRKLGIFLGTWYDQPIGPGKVDMIALQYQKGSCPNAEDITKRIMNLPTNVEEDTAQFVARELNSVVSE
jgi:dTDP-4-amino-4,6-dideoxygalactose transaminase